MRRTVLVSAGVHAAVIAAVAAFVAGREEPESGVVREVEVEVVGVAVREATGRTEPGAGTGTVGTTGTEGAAGTKAGRRRRLRVAGGDPFAMAGGAEHGVGSNGQPATGDRQPPTGGGGEGAGEGGGGGGGEGEGRPDAEVVRRRVQGVVEYPRHAKARGMEGVVWVRFRIGKGGAADGVTVVESAGAALDAAAVEAVRRGAPYATAEGWVRIPVRFELSPS